MSQILLHSDDGGRYCLRGNILTLKPLFISGKVGSKGLSEKTKTTNYGLNCTTAVFYKYGFNIKLPTKVDMPLEKETMKEKRKEQ